MGAEKFRDPAHRRYLVRTSAFMGGYMAVNVAAIAGAFDRIIGTPAGSLLGLAVAAPVAGHIWATVKLLNETDEFVRALTAKRFVVAAGLAMAVFSAWGFAETYGTAPHAPGWLIYPLFWFLFAVVTPLIRTSHT
jgi:putative oxidoreductase